MWWCLARKFYWTKSNGFFTVNWKLRFQKTCACTRTRFPLYDLNNKIVCYRASRAFSIFYITRGKTDWKGKLNTRELKSNREHGWANLQTSIIRLFPSLPYLKDCIRTSDLEVNNNYNEQNRRRYRDIRINRWQFDQKWVVLFFYFFIFLFYFSKEAYVQNDI